MHVLLWIVVVVAILLALGRLVTYLASSLEERSQRPSKPRAGANAELIRPPDQGTGQPIPPDESWTIRVHEAPAVPYRAPSDINVGEVEWIDPADKSVLDPLPQRPNAPEAKGPSQEVDKRLQIELVPCSMHYRNARAVVGPDLWALVRNIAMNSDGKKCVECGATECLECHEEWEYCQAPIRVMKMTRLSTLCHLCHMAKHLGLARRKGEYEDVQAHVETVYGLTEAELLSLEQKAIGRVKQLDKDGAYELDLTYLNDVRFLWVQHRFGRNFGTAELENCTYLVSDGELVS